MLQNTDPTWEQMEAGAIHEWQAHEPNAATASLQAENEEWKEKVLAKQEELIREIEKNLVLQAELAEARERNTNLLELLVIEACAKKMGVA